MQRWWSTEDSIRWLKGVVKLDRKERLKMELPFRNVFGEGTDYEECLKAIRKLPPKSER